MFWLKRMNKEDSRFSQFHDLLARSFANVKRDTANLFQWTNFLYQKSLEQESLIKRLEMELSYTPKKPEDIKRIIDTYYSYENLLNKIKALDQKIEFLEQKKPFKEKISIAGEIENRLERLEHQKKASIREKIVKRLTRNSKEYVKNMILSHIRKYGQIGALQLKDIIVDEQGLCSKSSFYRVLGAIEALEDIGVAKKGREKFYLYKAVKHL